MARDVDKRKTRKALNRIRRAKAAAEKAIAESPDAEAAQAARQALSDWETEFVTSVEHRLEEFGSAFADHTKGSLDEPLSQLQEAKLKEIEKKARGKGPKGFQSRKPMKQGSGFKNKKAALTSRSRDIHEDMDDLPEPVRQKGHLRLIKGGEDPST